MICTCSSQLLWHLPSNSNSQIRSGELKRVLIVQIERHPSDSFKAKLPIPLLCKCTHQLRNNLWIDQTLSHRWSPNKMLTCFICIQQQTRQLPVWSTLQHGVNSHTRPDKASLKSLEYCRKYNTFINITGIRLLHWRIITMTWIHRSITLNKGDYFT